MLHPRPVPFLAMNGILAVTPHDGAVRRAVERLCTGSPILRTDGDGNSSFASDRMGAGGAPPAPEGSLCDLIDGLRLQGHRGIGYRGSEPTLHPGLLNLVRHARSRGFEHQMLWSTGLPLADAEFAARVFEAGIDVVGVSLDTFDAKVQEQLCGGRAELRATLAGLQNALAAPGVEVLTSAVVDVLNARLLPEYMEEVDRLQRHYGKSIGVMLHLRKEPAVSGDAQEALALGLLEASRLVGAALSRARSLEVAASTFGFPPCLLGDAAQNVSELYATEWEVHLDSGAVNRSQPHAAVTHWAACATCPYSGYCPGVPKQYAGPEVKAAITSRLGRRTDTGSGGPERPPSPEPGTRTSVSLMAISEALAVLPHDLAARRLAERLWMPCATLKVGVACNISCTYCSVGSDGPPRVPEAELRRILAGLRSLGYRGFGYMGGEPTAHPDFILLARHAASLGFERQVLVTNGIRLADAEFASRAFDAGINVVIVSIDTFDQNVQERLYGRSGIFEKALEGLHRVLERPGVEVVLAAVVTALNAALLPRFMDEARALEQRYHKKIGVLLHALQRPARDGEAQRAISLGMLDASRLVINALSRADALGLAVLTFSIPPCLLPGHERKAVELYATEWVVELTTGASQRSQHRGATTYWNACTRCPHAGWCPGVLNQYADASVQSFVEALEFSGA